MPTKNRLKLVKIWLKKSRNPMTWGISKNPKKIKNYKKSRNCPGAGIFPENLPKMVKNRPKNDQKWPFWPKWSKNLRPEGLKRRLRKVLNYTFLKKCKIAQRGSSGGNSAREAPQKCQKIAKKIAKNSQNLRKPLGASLAGATQKKIKNKSRPWPGPGNPRFLLYYSFSGFVGGSKI